MDLLFSSGRSSTRVRYPHLASDSCHGTGTAGSSDEQKSIDDPNVVNDKATRNSSIKIRQSAKFSANQQLDQSINPVHRKTAW